LSVVTATVKTQPVCPKKTFSNILFSKLQILIVLSYPAEIINFSLFVMAKVLIMFVWPFNTPSSVFFNRFQILIVLSLPADTAYFLFLVVLIHSTLSVWPGNTDSSAFVQKFQTNILLSQADIKFLLSFVIAIAKHEFFCEKVKK
jgi:hypothetical protein